MKRDAIKTFGIVLIAANALIAFLSLTNLFLIAAGAIEVDVPDSDDLIYEYDASNRSLEVSTQFTVRNDGIYAVRHLDIESRLTTHTGYRLVEFNRYDLEVRPGEERTFPVEVEMDLARVADSELLRFLVEDGAFELDVRVRADYTLGLTKFRSDEHIEYPWTSPLNRLRELLVDGNLSAAAVEALGWAGPVVRQWLSDAVLDAAMAEGEWRSTDLGGWANLTYRLLVNETSGEGSFDMALRGQVAGLEWTVTGTVPLVVVDGVVYLEQEEVAHEA